MSLSRPTACRSRAVTTQRAQPCVCAAACGPKGRPGMRRVAQRSQLPRPHATDLGRRLRRRRGSPARLGGIALAFTPARAAAARHRRAPRSWRVVARCTRCRRPTSARPWPMPSLEATKAWCRRCSTKRCNGPCRPQCTRGAQVHGGVLNRALGRPFRGLDNAFDTAVGRGVAARTSAAAARGTDQAGTLHELIVVSDRPPGPRSAGVTVVHPPSLAEAHRPMGSADGNRALAVDRAGESPCPTPSPPPVPLVDAHLGELGDITLAAVQPAAPATTLTLDLGAESGTCGASSAPAASSSAPAAPVAECDGDDVSSIESDESPSHSPRVGLDDAVDPAAAEEAERRARKRAVGDWVVRGACLCASTPSPRASTLRPRRDRWRRCCARKTPMGTPSRISPGYSCRRFATALHSPRAPSAPCSIAAATWLWAPPSGSPSCCALLNRGAGLNVGCRQGALTPPSASASQLRAAHARPHQGLRASR